MKNQKQNNENICSWGGVNWYREKIVEMIESIENEDYLFKIYHYILAKYRRDKK